MNSPCPLSFESDVQVGAEGAPIAARFDGTRERESDAQNEWSWRAGRKDFVHGDKKPRSGQFEGRNLRYLRNPWRGSHKGRSQKGIRRMIAAATYVSRIRRAGRGWNGLMAA